MAVKCVACLAVGLLGLVLLVMQLEKTDFDPGGLSSYVSFRTSNSYVQLRHSFPRARRKRADCHLFNCFDIYRCSSHMGALKVHIVPVPTFYSMEGEEIALTVSQEFSQILQAVLHSEFYTADPDAACLFLPAVDTLNPARIGETQLEQMLARFPSWNQGENYLIFTLTSPGTLGIDKALAASASLSSLQYRPGFDVAVPLFVPPNITTAPSSISPPSPSNRAGARHNSSSRSWLLLVFAAHMEPTHLTLLQQSLSTVDGELLLIEDECSTLPSNGRSRNTSLPSSDGNRNYLEFCVRGGGAYPVLKLLGDAQFCLISSRGPAVAALHLSLAMSSGCIPVILTEELVLPFHEILDWTLFSLRMRPIALTSLPDLLRGFQPARYRAMSAQLHYVHRRFFSSPVAIALTTLHILNTRLFTQNIVTRQQWNQPHIAPSPLFLDRMPRPNLGFTAVILAYDRLESLFLLISKLSEVPSLARIVVVWNNQIIAPPPAESWPKIYKPLKVIQTSQNRLSNRFYPHLEIETECVLSLDDDITMLTTDEIEFAYTVWRQFPDRIVGFPSRSHYWSNASASWIYESEWKNDISIVLTGAAFYHKYWHYAYTTTTNPIQAEIREWVDSQVNCEDIAFNFLVANATGKPPIKVGPRKKFKCSTPACENVSMLSSDSAHLLQRSHCVERFARAYGAMPLRTVEFRVDPLLFKENLPSSLTKFSDMGVL